MIRLRPDCLAFKSPDGEAAVHAVHEFILELGGAGGAALDPAVLEHAAQAVLHYFKVEKEQSSVTMEEFAEALERALGAAGVQAKARPSAPGAPRAQALDLGTLAGGAMPEGEMFFFTRLRAEMRLRLSAGPDVIQFHGLRGCVMRLAGAKRWGARCQSLCDEIVGFLRECLTAEHQGARCALVVR
jgi:hypothetical protein